MADYYTKFSVVLPLPDAAAQSYAIDLASQARRIDPDEEVPANFPVSLAAVVEDWRFDTVRDSSEQCGIWLDSSEGGVDAACAFIQHLLQKFNPKGRVTMEWSFDCSKPRPDAYGGGAAVITATRIKSTSTTEWLRKQARSSGRANINERRTSK